jgi:hypothetical protein
MQDDLLNTLRSLELALHHPGSAIQSDALDALLHPDFHEIGKSGLAYTRAQVLNFLSQHPGPLATEAHDFQVSHIAAGVALLNYRSVHFDAAQPLHVLRSSVWLQHEGRWRLRYHQGTVAHNGG